MHFRSTLTISVIAFATCLLSQDLSAAVQNVAVNDFAPRGVLPSDASIVSERLRSELVRGGVFRVMDRGQMDVVLREQAFQQSGACDQSECAIQIGKLLAVDEMVVGSVGKIGNLFTLSAQLMDVGTGAIVLTANQDFQGPIEDFLSQAVPLLAAKLSAGKQGSQAGASLADLFVASVPAGASIELDGTLRPESTPATLQGVAPGVHRLRLATLSHAGTAEVALASGELRKLSVDLKPARGTLKIVTRPPGAVAWLDGQKLAETPFKQGVAAGAHLLEVRLPAHVPVRESLVVRPDALVERGLELPTGQNLLLLSEYRNVRVKASAGNKTQGLHPDSVDNWLATGNWSLQVRDPRFSPWDGNVVVGNVEPSPIRLSLVAKGLFADSLAKVRSGITRRHGWGWASFGGALAAFGAAGYFHYDAFDNSKTARRASRDYDDATFGQNMSSFKQAQNDAANAANESLVKAWIADGIGGLLLANAIVHWSF